MEQATTQVLTGLCPGTVFYAGLILIAGIVLMRIGRPKAGK